MIKKYITTDKTGEEVEVTKDVALKLIESGKKTMKDFIIEEFEEENNSLPKITPLTDADEDILSSFNSLSIRKPIKIGGERIEGDVQPDEEKGAYAKALEEFKGKVYNNYKNSIAREDIDAPYMMPRVDFADYLQDKLTNNSLNYKANDGKKYDFSKEDAKGLETFQGTMDVLSIPGRAIGAGIDAIFTDEDFTKSMANVDESDPLYKYNEKGEPIKDDERVWWSDIIQSVVRDPATVPTTLAGGPLVNLTKGLSKNIATKFIPKSASRIPAFIPKTTGAIATKLPLAASEASLYEGVNAIDDYGSGIQTNRGLKEEDLSDRLLNTLFATAGGAGSDAVLGRIAKGLRRSGTTDFMRSKGVSNKLKNDAAFTDDLTNYLTSNYSDADLKAINSGLGEGRTAMVNKFSRDFTPDLVKTEPNKLFLSRILRKNPEKILNDPSLDDIKLSQEELAKVSKDLENMIANPNSLSYKLSDKLTQLVKDNKFVDEKATKKVQKKFDDVLLNQKRRSDLLGEPLNGNDLLELRTSLRDNMNRNKMNQKLTKPDQIADDAIYEAISDVIYTSISDNAGKEGLKNPKIFDQLFSSTMPISNVTTLDVSEHLLKPSTDVVGDIFSDIVKGNMGGSAGIVRDLASNAGVKRRALANVITPSGTKPSLKSANRQLEKNPNVNNGPLTWLQKYNEAGLEGPGLYDETLAADLLPSNTAEYWDKWNPGNITRPFRAGGIGTQNYMAHDLVSRMLDSEDNKNK